jgi:hypothetical protein
MLPKEFKRVGIQTNRGLMRPGMYQNFFTNTVHLVSLIVAALLCPTAHTAVQEQEVVYLGAAQGQGIAVDGELGSGEWGDAGVVTIEVTPHENVPVRYTYDRENLYFAFSGLKRGAEILYPEVLIDSRSERNESWSPGVRRFHVSNNLCEADGAHDVYTLNGVFQCSHTKPGWSANIPPSDNGVVEFRISLSKFSLSPDVGTKIGLAFDVTNATGNDQQRWSLWPPNAKLGVPSTWAEAVLIRSNARVSSNPLGDNPCHERDQLTAEHFVSLMQTIADAWNSGDASKAASCFVEDAIYSAPPSSGHHGRQKLYDYFGGKGGRPLPMHMTWHHLVFDPSKQIGFGEYTFRYRMQTHGIVIVKIDRGLIKNWREYEVESVQNWEDFIGANSF